MQIVIFPFIKSSSSSKLLPPSLPRLLSWPPWLSRPRRPPRSSSWSFSRYWLRVDCIVANGGGLLLVVSHTNSLTQSLSLLLCYRKLRKFETRTINDIPFGIPTQHKDTQTAKREIAMERERESRKRKQPNRTKQNQTTKQNQQNKHIYSNKTNTYQSTNQQQTAIDQHHRKWRTVSVDETHAGWHYLGHNRCLNKRQCLIVFIHSCICICKIRTPPHTHTSQDTLPFNELSGGNTW